MAAENEMKEIRISVLLHLAAGVAMGLVSVYVGSGLAAIAAAVVAGVIVGHVTQRIVGKKPFSWWFGNGLFMYFFVWFDVMIFIANYF